MKSLLKYEPNWWQMLLFIWFVSFCLAQCEHDNSDSPDHKSGMTPYTDHLTGCEYLGHGWGGLTPRIDGHGRQIGCRDR